MHIVLDGTPLIQNLLFKQNRKLVVVEVIQDLELFLLQNGSVALQGKWNSVLGTPENQAHAL